LLERFSALIAYSFFFFFTVTEGGSGGHSFVFAVRAHRHRSERFAAFVTDLFSILDQAFHRVAFAVRAQRHSCIG